MDRKTRTEADRVNSSRWLRYGSIALLALAWGLLGASCLPFNDRSPALDLTPTTLSISLVAPSGDVTIPQGDTFKVRWSGANLTGSQAVVTLFVRASGEIDGTILEGGALFDGTSLTDSFDWDTTGFPGGSYRITVRVESGTQTKESTSTGAVLIDAPPTFVFTDPVNDVEVPNPDPNDPNVSSTVLIRWQAGDADSSGNATAKIELDPDTDHTNGNEIEIHSADIPTETAFDSFDFDGTDPNLGEIDEGTYHLFARVGDTVSPDRDVESGITITIPPAPEATPTTTALTDPNTDESFLVSDGPHLIKMEFAEPNDVLIDLRIDRDDNHLNGNETTILFQEAVSKTTHKKTYEWNRHDSNGALVQDGIYRVFMAVSRGNGQSPTQFEATGKFLCRTDPNQPLISLIAPATDIEVTAGSSLNIQWRDDVPNGTATVRLTIDDDDFPDEAVETDGAEVQILSGRDAGIDEVQDSFSYPIPNTLAPGRYTVFAYIDRDGAAPWENTSVSGGHFTIKDPNAP